MKDTIPKYLHGSISRRDAATEVTTLARCIIFRQRIEDMLWRKPVS
jgi:hypothetical protein